MKTLAQVLQRLPAAQKAQIPAAALTATVTGVTSDSRLVRAGSIFVAVRGGSRDGHQFVADAAKAGAVLVFAETGVSIPSSSGSVPVITVPDPREALALAAAGFYGHPSEKLLMVGVTGTSGKTTSTYLIESILREGGRNPGVIGTVNFRYGGKVIDSTHTTPGAPELQKLLADILAAGCDSVVMEVSSHALKQHRVDQVAFDGMVFTNLTPEHLDFHPDMDDYFNAKKLLFTTLAAFAVSVGKKPFGAINAESDYGQRLLKELERDLPGGARAEGFAVPPTLAFGIDGIRGEAEGVSVSTPLTGRFNAANVMGALKVARGLGVSADAVRRGIAALPIVPGRLERVSNSRGIHVLVDYAHKPDALDNVLRTLREVKGRGRLITVFGCGGDRDRKKRPLMGRIATEFSDLVIVTSDNPRTEKPEAIVQEILAGIEAGAAQVEIERPKAIMRAIEEAQPGDIVLIAGKGHEDYQIIADPTAETGTRKIHMDDRELAAEALARK